MRRGQKWIGAAGLLAALLGAAWLALALWIPSNAELAARAEAQLQQRLGVPVRVGALHWRLLPRPAVVLEDVSTGQSQPLSIKHLTVLPDLPSLLHRRFKLRRVDVDGATLPQLSLRALGGAVGPVSDDAETTPLDRLVFRNVTWISRYGTAVVFDGEVDFDPQWRPRRALLRRPGAEAAFDLTLDRQAQEDRWTTRINVGGGTAHGELRLQTRASGKLHLEGELQPRDIEVASALAAFNRRSIIAGKASGQTALSASGDTLGDLAKTLHTRTAFTVGRSTLLRFDLEKAIRSAGTDHAGQTTLDSVTGQLDTQNTPQGMVVDYSRVKAVSGAFTASGRARLANRQVDAEFAVDLVDGIVGVPLQLSGPVDKISVSVPKSAIAGAVIGTAVLPGVGTAIGARLGSAIGKIFSPDPANKAPVAPAPRRP